MAYERTTARLQQMEDYLAGKEAFPGSEAQYEFLPRKRGRRGIGRGAMSPVYEGSEHVWDPRTGAKYRTGTPGAMALSQEWMQHPSAKSLTDFPGKLDESWYGPTHPFVNLKGFYFEGDEQKTLEGLYGGKPVRHDLKHIRPGGGWENTTQRANRIARGKAAKKARDKAEKKSVWEMFFPDGEDDVVAD